MSKKFPQPNRKTTTAFRDLVIISAIFILVSVLVDVFRVFAIFQEWVREQPQWSQWRIHDYLFTFVILALALGVFSLRRWIELRREIAERKRAEEALSESEEKWRVLFNESADGLIVADPVTATFRSVNQAICRMLGYSEAELLTLGVADIHPPADLPTALNAFPRHARHGEMKVAPELPMLRKDGTVFYADVGGTMVVVDGERLLLGAFRDVTERKKAKEERERLILELKDALANVRQLGKLLPICASCKKIRDDKGYWTQVEKYVMDHSDATFSHGVCPQCMQKLYPEYNQNIQKAVDGES